MYDYWTFVDIFQNSSFQKQFVQKKIFNYGRFRFVQIMNPGQCGEILGEAGGGRGGGDGGSNYYIVKFKKKHSAKKSLILHRSTDRAD